MKSSSLLAAFQAPTEASPGGVFGTLAPAAPVFAPVKRLRRPALAAVPSGGDSGRYAMLGSASGLQPSRLAGLAAAAPRRAFSAVGPAPTMLDEGSSFENSMEMSSPAQMVVRRQATRTLRRCDGAEELRPSSPARAMPAPAVSNMESPSARYMASSGLPGFGDNESLGKILPCHRVKEDGLMRISPTTVSHGTYSPGIRLLTPACAAQHAPRRQVQRQDG
jgi:M-phase inducer tyrosine phosphatase